MVELGDELIEEIRKLGLPLEGLPEGAKPLNMRGYYFFDIEGRRIIYEPFKGNYLVRRIIPMPLN